MVPEGVIHILEAIQVEDQERRLRSAAAGPFKGIAQSVLEETPVGQTRQGIMQGKMLVVLDLLFKQKEDHAESHEVFRQIPDFTFDDDIGKPGIFKGREEKHRGPGEKSVDRNETSRGGATVRVPEMDAAIKVRGEKHGVHSQAGTGVRPLLNEEKEDRKAKIDHHRDPAKGMTKSR